MLNKIKSIKDVVDWGLCIGCGACAYACNKNAIFLKNIESIGIRPIVDTNICDGNCECINICPGYQVDGYMEKGWEFVANLPNNMVILRYPS